MKKRKLLSMLLSLSLIFSGTFINPVTVKASTTAETNVGITYQGHVQKVGWQKWVSDGIQAGTTGKALRVEALKIKLTGENLPEGASITYQGHVQKIGWQKWVSDGELAGTTGMARRVEALKIKLNNMPGYSIKYRVHVQKIGWQDWVSDGELAGTTGKALRLEAIEIKLVKTSSDEDNSGTGTSTDIGNTGTGSDTGSGTSSDGGNSSVTTPDDSATYVAPLPDSYYYETIKWDDLPNVLDDNKKAQYIIKDNNTKQYISPNDTNSKAYHDPLTSGINNSGLIANGDLSIAVNTNIHNGNYVFPEIFTGDEMMYICGDKSLDVINDQITHSGEPELWANGVATEPIWAYTERTTCDSNDVTKLTNAAKTLHTKFLPNSEVYTDMTFDDYSVWFDTVHNTNVIVRYVVYNRKTN